MPITKGFRVAKGSAEDTLAYFSAEPILTGSLVDVPLGKRSVAGIVVASDKAENLKSEIKSASFEMRKISGTKNKPFFLPQFIEAATCAADHFASTTSAVVATLTPKAVLESASELVVAHTDRRQSPMHEQYIIQTDEEERFAHYKSLIRETFAKKGSVFFCLPTIHDIQTTAKKLEKGIEEYTFVLHSGLSKKELAARCAKMLACDHPVLIIATGPFLSLPRSDIGAIVIEKESSRSYKTQQRPFIDIRTFAEFFAKAMRAKLVFGDIFLQTETVFRYQNGEFAELYPLKFRSLTTCQSTVVDMKKYKTGLQFSEGSSGGANRPSAHVIGVQANSVVKKWRVLSDELAALIQHNQTENEHLFIFVARKGMSPTTICGDCGTIVPCRTCQSPMVLHTSAKGAFFLCHKCGERRGAEERCAVCDSWRLVTLGAGTEKIEEEIRKIAPSIQIFSLDKDQTKTHTQATKVAKAFYDTPGSILIGTEMALLYLDTPIENSAVATIDSIFSIPDFKISEKVLGILLHMRSLTQKQLLLQTRNPEQTLFDYALKGNLLDFYREEIALRTTFNYPPASVLVKLSIEGKKDAIVDEMSRVKVLFNEDSTEGSPTTTNREFDVFPSFVKGRDGKSVLNALMKIPRKRWPDRKVVDILSGLSPQWTIKIDPDSLL